MTTTSLADLKDTLLQAIVEYEYEVAKDGHGSSKRIEELTDTIAKLSAENWELKDKVKELSDTLSKIVASSPDFGSTTSKKKKVIHG